MAWLTRDKAPLVTGENRKDTPDGLWEQCKECKEIIFKRAFEANLYVCPKCQFHYPCPPVDRLTRFLDPDTFEEIDGELTSLDPLSFKDAKSYKDRLVQVQKKMGRPDAFVSAQGTLLGRPVQVGSFDFEFMGGSMGTVVGEKITRIFQRSEKLQQPAIIFSSSGGARMHEGILSLMQMAKTCTALGDLRAKGIPYISVLTHPTTGGVAASFAMLGDVNIGEPKALIGFAGPRVIQQTIREELPEGFQRSEYLLDHGMLDFICHRRELRQRIGELLDIVVKESHA